MDAFIRIVIRWSRYLNYAAGVMLVLMMLLTVFDVALRFLGRPLAGTYELMGYTCALLIGFTLAQTTLDDGHVKMEIITERLSMKQQHVILIHVEVILTLLFALLSFGLFLKGHDLQEGKEVSLTLRAPLYPVAYALAVCSFLQCFVYICELIRIARKGGQNE